jgi:hypothetical protein
MFVAGCAAILLIASGCSPAGPSIVGTWEASGIKNMPADGKVETTFTAPDQVKMVISGTQMGMKFQANVTGTYKLAGDKLTMNLNKADVNLLGLTPDQEKKFAENKPAADAAFLKEVGGDLQNTIKWVDNNTIEMKEKDMTTTMKRKV